MRSRDILTLQSARKWLSNESFPVRICDQLRKARKSSVDSWQQAKSSEQYLDRDIRPRHTHERSREDSRHRQRRPEPFPLQRITPAFAMERIIEPEETRHSVRVPRREQRGCDPSEVREDRHGTRQHERQCHGDKAKPDPGRPAEDGVHVDVVGAPEEADEDELGCRMGVDRACSARGD